MSIDPIFTYYRGGVYDPTQSERIYLNTDINTTVGSISAEYFEVSDPLIPPTWNNKLTIYQGHALASPGNLDLLESTKSINSSNFTGNTYQQMLTIVNTSDVILTIYTYEIQIKTAINFIYTNNGNKDGISLVPMLVDNSIIGQNYSDYLYWDGTIWAVGDSKIHLGTNAGYVAQGDFTVAVGSNAGMQSQGEFAIAIGNKAGTQSQGDFAIAIGNNAGCQDQPPNSIVINAANTVLSGDASGLFINPIRGVDTNTGNLLYYNTSNNEITHTLASGNTQIQPTNVNIFDSKGDSIGSDKQTRALNTYITNTSLPITYIPVATQNSGTFWESVAVAVDGISDSLNSSTSHTALTVFGTTDSPTTITLRFGTNGSPPVYYDSQYTILANGDFGYSVVCPFYNIQLKSCSDC